MNYYMDNSNPLSKLRMGESCNMRKQKTKNKRPGQVKKMLVSSKSRSILPQQEAHWRRGAKHRHKNRLRTGAGSVIEVPNFNEVGIGELPVVGDTTSNTTRTFTGFLTSQLITATELYTKKEELKQQKLRAEILALQQPKGTFMPIANGTNTLVMNMVLGVGAAFAVTTLLKKKKRRG